MPTLWLQRIVLIGIVALGCGMVLMVIASQSLQIHGQDAPLLRFGAGLCMGLFAIVSLIFWINEIIYRFRRSVNNGMWISGVISDVGWIVVTNIFGAWFYSIRKAYFASEQVP